MMNMIAPPKSRDEFIILALGIAPLLVVTDTVEKGTAIGGINLVVMVLSGLAVSVIRNLLPEKTRLTAILVINATIVSLIIILMQLYLFDLSQKLAIYIPLIAVNCLVLAWAEEYALRNTVLNSVMHVLLAGAGIYIMLVLLAFVREYSGLALLKQPAGAFLVLALLLAASSKIAVTRTPGSRT